MDRATIAAILPHAGAMCLIDSVLHCDAHEIVCRSDSHRRPANPLADADGMLRSACALEYAAQAMALHHALRDAGPADPSAGPMTAPPPARLPRGMLVGARELILLPLRLDTLPTPLEIRARLESGDAGAALYALQVRAGERLVIQGRATVLIEAPN